MGVVGILLGTVISVITTCFWIEPLVVFRHGFKRTVRTYYGLYFMYTAIAAADVALTYFVCSRISAPGFAGVFLKAIICVLIYNAVVVALFFRSSQMKEVINRIKNMRKDGQ